MQTLSVQSEIKMLEAELNLAAALGREYFSDESRAMRTRLNELRFKDFIK